MKLYPLLFLVVSIAFFSCKSDPCSTKDGFLQSFESFLKEYETTKAELTQEQLFDYDHRFESIVNTCYKKFKPELTLKERQNFWQEAIGFLISRHDGEFSLDISDNMDDPFYKYIKDEVMELLKESGASYLFSLQQVFKDELPKLMELFSTEIENFGKELMGIFNN